MNTRQLKWAAAALLVAVILWVVSEQSAEQPDDRETGRVMPEQVEGVNRIVFASSTDTVALMRSGATWTVNGFTIDNARLVTLLTALQDSTNSEIVATSATVHRRMGVDGTGTTVTFFRGDDMVATVLFGNRAADQSSMYARDPGEDLVYRYAGPLAGLVALGQNDWRSKVLVDVSAETITRIAVDRAGEEYILTRQGGSWALSSGAAVDTEKVEMMLSKFRPLEAGSIASDEHREAADFSMPERRITLYGADEAILGAIVYDSLDDTGFAVRARGNETVYHVPRWNLDQIMPTEESLHAASE